MPRTPRAPLSADLPSGASDVGRLTQGASCTTATNKTTRFLAEEPEEFRVAIRALVLLLARQAVREALDDTPARNGETHGQDDQD